MPLRFPFGRKKGKGGPDGNSVGDSSKSKISSSGNSNSNSKSKKNSNSNSKSKKNSTNSGISNPASPGEVNPDSSTTFRVNVPESVKPGEEFQVYAGSRIVRVKCPAKMRAGQSLQITVPSDPTGKGGAAGPNDNRSKSDAGGTAGIGSNNEENSPNVQPVPGSDPRAYMVEIPTGVRGGQQFQVMIRGQTMRVTCPPNARAGLMVKIVPPPPPSGTGGNSSATGSGTNTIDRNDKPDTQMFEVVVPNTTVPGQSFALLAGGVRVLVTCPADASAGQKIRFNLPAGFADAANTAKKKRQKRNSREEMRLSYDKDGWTRTVRVSDMKFQWVRVDDKGDVDLRTKRFDAKLSAYVRKIDFVEGPDPRMRGGFLSLVQANEASVDSRIRAVDGRELVSFSDIASTQVKKFDEKVHWFQTTCKKLCVEWNEGHMRMNVRRDFLLIDSMEAVMSLSRKDLRKVWRFEFIGEAGLDAGGLAREWFQLVTEEIFDPDMGLWQSSFGNQMCMQINAASEISCPEDHLVYFRFLGRVMGKALFDSQLVAGHMVQYLYKHILGWPIAFGDLESIDDDYYQNLKKVMEMKKEEIEYLYLDFSQQEEIMGVNRTIDLIPDGSNTDLTGDNLPEYLEACLQYRMIGGVKAQLNELLLGFFDVIPEPLLTVFDFQELELLMCGLPTIDMENWKEHTEYSGEYGNCGGNHDAVRWFWEVVDDMDQEMKARLLQFVTGTSGVPARGFGVLQGTDGSIRRFTIHGLEIGTCLYPRSHTCFNRIDLPTYSTKKDLAERLNVSVTMAATGFDIE